MSFNTKSAKSFHRNNLPDKGSGHFSIAIGGRLKFLIESDNRESLFKISIIFGSLESRAIDSSPCIKEG